MGNWKKYKMKFKVGDKVRFTKKFENWCRERFKRNGTDFYKSPYKTKYVWGIIETENEGYVLKSSSFRWTMWWYDRWQYDRWQYEEPLEEA